MKRAKVVPFTVDVLCPHCHEPILDPESGSLSWEYTSSLLKAGQILTCHVCGEQVVVPKRVSPARL